MEVVIEKGFELKMLDVEENGGLVSGVIHSINLSDIEDLETEGEIAEAGTLVFSLEGSETYQEYPLTIWGDGCSEAYLCFPTTLEENEDDDEYEDDEDEGNQIITLDELLIGDKLLEMLELLESKTVLSENEQQQKKAIKSTLRKI
ncbi:hypothetical protein [Bacillus toyonensis]|uniref:hypothetical protein n=1 Tax=Bacillus toyonensis TaxID=155322 RepID=UPI002E1D1F2F|nr:hypothetical protein [Bacillus toyonensis]